MRRACVLATSLLAATAQAGPQVDVVHWWTSPGETAAMHALADAYRAAGGQWRDLAVVASEQARAVVLERIKAGNPPTAAQFNPSRSFVQLARQGRLNALDDIAAQNRWAETLPAVLMDAVRVDGHIYAVPISIHMPAWLWSSKAALAKAGIRQEPRSIDEFFAALDKLQAAGLIPLAHGGQPWQDLNLFSAMLANQGGRELYLAVLRDRDAAALQGEALRHVLVNYKKLRRYVDAASPGRSWSDTTALLISGRAGLQFMGDWVKGEFTAAGQQPGRDYGCATGLSPRSPYIVDGDVLVFPKDKDGSARAAQQLLARVATAPSTQLAFSARKGSVPVRTDLDTRTLDACARLGAAALRDAGRLVGNTEMLLAPEQLTALENAVSDYWNRDIPAQVAQQAIARILQNPNNSTDTRRQP
ncbi:MULTISPECIES: ABC transporter substrate-binding protein [unclassified Roseateles]|uniref:ABC transporter substrate-binding protein n=1 Tax=unclassified Roseateles TaxID=2626991 RepID=UPI0006FC92F7|nr:MULTISPECIES: ABC transporter substrate-binding protein [unclassified Roseateles]KQW42921.1 sugar ABC transporter substrate-binding protein [Pelomonas sp. Root405]KRA69599.1 sugar ABC transporter substrate-binding protein [Pelomonas sp. Root662]